MNIETLRSMNKIEFAKAIRKLKKDDMKNILISYGIYAPSKLKTDEVLEMLLNAVDGLIEPTEEDKKKIEKSAKRKANAIKLTEEEKKLIEEIEDFIKWGKYDLESEEVTIEEFKKKCKSYYKKIHHDVCSKAIKRYKGNLFNELREFEERAITRYKNYVSAMNIIKDLD